jgi:hypothetical protein
MKAIAWKDCSDCPMKWCCYYRTDFDSKKCPHPDVPEPSRFTRIVLDPHVETYDDACVDFVEKLRKS